MKTPRILTKTFWDLKAQKPGPGPVTQPTARDTKPTRGTGAVIDNLALAARIISDAVDKFPFVGPVAALLSQILKKCRVYGMTLKLEVSPINFL
jgi:hypothetical protein